VPSGTATLYIDTGVTTTKLYYYAVTALSDEGCPACTEGAMTPIVRILTPPATPTGLTVRPAAGLALDLEWGSVAFPSEPNQITGYKVFRATYPEAMSPALIANRFGQYATSFLDSSSLALGQRYYYWTAAFYQLGLEYAQSLLSSTTYGLVEPGAPTGLTGQPANGMVLLSWMDLRPGQEVDLYHIYRSTVSTSVGFTQVATFSGTYYDDTGLVNGKTYYHRVSADNWGGEGAYAGTLGVAPYDPPTAPGTLAAISRPQQILLNWGLSTPTAYPIDGYEVLRSVTSGTETLLVYLSSDSASVYLDTSFAAGDNGTTFFYIVRARDTLGGVSLPSNEASTAPAIPPCPPSMLTYRCCNPRARKHCYWMTAIAT